MVAELKALLDQTGSMHKHLCPRQVLGVRMGMLAGELLGLGLPQRGKRLFTFIETDGCAADGVSVATGCWVGRRTLRVVDFGKVAATFVDTETGEAIRIWPSPESRRLATEWASDARSRWHAQLEAYQQMPSDLLLRSHPVELTVDLRAILSRPGVRTVCGRCGEEIINQREILLDGEVCCRACAGEAYCTLVSEPHWRIDIQAEILGA